jgi:hypothetical protein
MIGEGEGGALLTKRNRRWKSFSQHSIVVTMKSFRLSTIVVAVAFASAAPAAETAYTALRVVGTQKGQALLNRVVELRGRNGTPQPAVWKIVFTDPAARAGVQEIEVQRGKIIAERAPTLRGPVGEAMDFTHLNLDSEGVFTVVNQEAAQQGLPFDRVDYTLRSGSGGGSPVWTAELFDGRNGKVGSFQIAADSGAILGRSKSGPPVVDSPNDRDFVRPAPGGPEPVYRDETAQGGYSQPGEKFRGIGDFFHRLGQRVERRSTQLENFFTGKRDGSSSGR